MIDGKPAFEIPLAEAAQVQQNGKNEAVIEFQQNEDAHADTVSYSRINLFLG